MTPDPSEWRKSQFRPLPEWVEGPTTRLVHGARRPDRNAGSVTYPIYQTSTFRFPAAHSEAVDGPYHYSRNSNPTVEGPAELLRQLEGGEVARLFASGMGAISATVLSLLRTGDEVVALQDLYGGTGGLLADLLPRYGVRVRTLSDGEARSPEAHVRPGTRLALLETPTNPTLRVHDIARWATACDVVGAHLVVDNTFATALNQRPLALGADVVVQSATKYLGGHSDLTAGVVVGPAALLARIDPFDRFGATLDPFAAFLLQRSLGTLALRVARQNENGRRVVEALHRHPAVTRVCYPGSGSPEEEGIAARQMSGRGGMLAISLAGGARAVDAFLHGLRLVQVAASLGGVESLASVPRLTSHRLLSDEARHARGIDDGLVRISLGIEDPDDLVRDLTRALDGIG